MNEDKQIISDIDTNSNNAINDAYIAIEKKDFQAAKKILNEYLELCLPESSETETIRYFSFENIIEFYCFKEKFKIAKEIVWTNHKIDVAYQLLAYISIEEKDFDKARDYISKGLYYNPMNLELHFKNVETYKMQNNIAQIYESTISIYPYIYNHNDLAEYYRLLGHYYIAKYKLDIAYSLYAISIHYQLNNSATANIGYIKKQFDNQNYKLTSKEIITILSNNSIPLTISDENLEQLKRIVQENELIQKVPQLISKVNDSIKILTEKINENTIINGLEIEKPIITSESIFDDNKIILDEQDKLRISNNIELLKQQNLPYIDNMKDVPISLYTKLKSKEEILKKLIVHYAIATCSAFSLDGEADKISVVINQMDKKLNLKSFLSASDNELLNSMLNQKISKAFSQNLTWLYEHCAVMMWILGLMEKPNPYNECNVNIMDELLISINNYDELYSKCSLKSKEEIMQYADLIFRYNWACCECKIKALPLNSLNEKVIQKQKEILEWILNWKIENILKENINISVKRKNINFIFNCPTYLHVSKITNENEQSLLLSLNNNQRYDVIELHDLGPNNNVDSLNDIYENDKKIYMNNSYNVLNECQISLSNIESIKKIILEKDSKLVLILYYFVLNNNIILMKNIIFDDNNHLDMNNIQNTINAKIASNILLSIK